MGNFDLRVFVKLNKLSSCYLAPPHLPSPHFIFLASPPHLPSPHLADFGASLVPELHPTIEIRENANSEPISNFFMSVFL